MIRRTAFFSRQRLPVAFTAASASSPFVSNTVSSFPCAATVCPSPLIAASCQPKLLDVGSPYKNVFTQARSFSSSSTALARGAGQSSVQANYTPATTGGGESTADSLTPQVRAHLMRVYNLLGAGVLSSSVSCALMIMTPLGKVIPWWFPMIGGMVPLFWLMFKPPATVQGRLGLFFAFTTLEGMALGPIVKMTLAKGVLGSALVMTGAVFCGFSAAAYLSPRASLLKFQGPLIGMLMGMLAISLLNMIYPSAFAHSIVLYGGLAIFSAFVAVDTQAMIERARCGAGDHVQDALQMFLNVINIFVRIAQILGMSSN